MSPSSSILPSRTARVLPPLLSLLYPLLVWCVTSITPAALPLTLAPALISLLYLLRFATIGSHPRATGIAYFAVGSPALYSFLGGWLDFQSALPFRANSVWIVLWILLALLAATEPHNASSTSNESPSQTTDSQTLPFAHGLSAAGITVFALFHMTNHLAGLAGGETHLAVMHSFRKVYRFPAIELLLGALILFQIVSGIYLLFRRRRARDWFEVLQGASGAYLVLFFASHLSAVLRTRYLYHVDTNWIWLTGANFLKDAWSARLVPYYFLGIIALGVHGSCGIRAVLVKHNKPGFGTFLFWTLSSAAVVVSAAIMFALIRGSLGSSFQPRY